MSLSAFQADEKSRALVLHDLRANLELGRVVPGPLSWNGREGSVVGCILQSEDLTQWELDLGLPQWLAICIDALSSQQETANDACDLASRILESIQPGVDLQTAGSVVILEVLALLDAGFISSLPPSLKPAFDTVRSLHQRAADGESVPPNEWRRARTAATALTDTLAGKRERSCAACLETAAWDPRRSRSVVFDTLRVWRSTTIEGAISDYGWDDKSDDEMRTLLQSLYDRYVVDTPEPQPTVFEMLAKYHPDEDARLRGKYKLEREVDGRTLQQVSDMLLHVLQKARPGR